MDGILTKPYRIRYKLYKIIIHAIEAPFVIGAERLEQRRQKHVVLLASVCFNWLWGKFASDNYLPIVIGNALCGDDCVDICSRKYKTLKAAKSHSSCSTE